MSTSRLGRLSSCLILAGLSATGTARADDPPATPAPAQAARPGPATSAGTAAATSPASQAPQSSPPLPAPDAEAAPGASPPSQPVPPASSAGPQTAPSGGKAAPASPPAAAPPPPGAPSPKPLPLPPTIAQVQVSGVLGRAVVGPDKQQLGHIVNVLVDMSGQPRAAVIDFGGFMGLGSRKIAVDWSAFTFPPSSDAEARLSLTPDEIKNTPEYTGSGQPVKVVSPSTPAPSPGP